MKGAHRELRDASHPVASHYSLTPSFQAAPWVAPLPELGTPVPIVMWWGVFCKLSILFWAATFRSFCPNSPNINLI